MRSGREEASQVRELYPRTVELPLQDRAARWRQPMRHVRQDVAGLPELARGAVDEV